MDKLFEWVEGLIDDEKIFPTEPGASFPNNFMDIIKNIFKRLFRVYGHIYHHHFKNVVNLQAEAHLNSCFKHFMYFTLQFNLIDPKELTPLAELIQELITL
jgi:MOB kinase activator 1